MTNNYIKVQGGELFFVNPFISFEKIEDRICFYKSEKIYYIFCGSEVVISLADAKHLQKNLIGSINNSESIFNNPLLAKAIFNWDNSNEIENIFSLIKPHKDELGLDVGCGYGRILLPLLEKGARLDGIDSSLALIKYLKKGIRKHNDISVFCGKIQDFIAPNTYKYAISALNTIRYLETKWDFYKHMECLYESLTSNGLYIINCSIPNNPSKYQEIRWNYKYQKKDYNITWSRIEYNFITEQIIDKIEITHKTSKQIVSHEYQLQAHFSYFFWHSFLKENKKWNLKQFLNNEFKPTLFNQNINGTFWLILEKK